jgi:hypothetical protein
MPTRPLAEARRVSIVSSANGSGKTTLGRELASMLDAPFIELDALLHGPDWVETPTDAVIAGLEPTLVEPRWVVDSRTLGPREIAPLAVAARAVALAGHEQWA